MSGVKNRYRLSLWKAAAAIFNWSKMEPLSGAGGPVALELVVPAERAPELYIDTIYIP